MPLWRISEPYINLWLEDEPLGYQPALGPRISLGINFKQRGSTTGFDTNIFSIGTANQFHPAFCRFHLNESRFHHNSTALSRCLVNNEAYEFNPATFPFWKRQP